MSERDRSHSGALQPIAEQTGFSIAAVEAMARAIAAGGGRMAQFDHAEFGGAGQWMAGGMLMIPDGSNEALRGRVRGLADALADALAASPAPSVDRFDASFAGGSHQSQSQLSGGLSTAEAEADDGSFGRWWPASLGTPETSGAQDGMRYAWFGRARRLVIDDGGRIEAYDTGDHRIDGVSQQQGGRRTLSFTSQHGTIDVAGLPIAALDAARGAATNARADAPSGNGSGAEGVASPAQPSSDRSADPFAALERLAELHARGVVDAAEFAAKKAELLARI